MSGIVICNRIDCPGDSVPLVGTMLLPGKRFVVAVQRRFNVCEVLVSVARQIKLLPLDWHPWLPMKFVGVTESAGGLLITIVAVIVWLGTVVPVSLSDTVIRALIAPALACATFGATVIAVLCPGARVDCVGVMGI